MKVKDQKAESSRLNIALSQGKPICESRFLYYDTLNVISTHPEDYNDLLKAIEQLLSTSIRIYARIEKPKKQKVEEVLVEEAEE